MKERLRIGQYVFIRNEQGEDLMFIDQIKTALSEEKLQFVNADEAEEMLEIHHGAIVEMGCRALLGAHRDEVWWLELSSEGEFEPEDNNINFEDEPGYRLGSCHENDPGSEWFVMKEIEGTLQILDIRINTEQYRFAVLRERLSVSEIHDRLRDAGIEPDGRRCFHFLQAAGEIVDEVITDIGYAVGPYDEIIGVDHETQRYFAGIPRIY